MVQCNTIYKNIFHGASRIKLETSKWGKQIVNSEDATNLGENADKIIK